MPPGLHTWKVKFVLLAQAENLIENGKILILVSQEVYICNNHCIYVHIKSSSEFFDNLHSAWEIDTQGMVFSE